MARFWIDYSTSVCIEADTKEEAISQFWAGDESNEVARADVEIDNVEEGDV